ncbi:MAG: acyl-CoA dehydrogenase family protein [Acidimicrobiia bacterium]
MPVAFSYEAVTERLRAELRAWGLEMVRPHEREVERTGRLPVNIDDILAACPVHLGALAFTELRSDSAGHDKEFIASFGDEGSNVLAAILAEEMAYAGVWATNLLKTGGGPSHKTIKQMGTPEQIERWVGLGLKGCFALTEPHFGSDAAAVATTAVRDGNEWVINGTKMFISQGASADFAVVFATVDRSQGRNGIRAFVIDKGTEGFVVARASEDKLGYRHTETSELQFTDVRIPLDNCLGGPDQAPGKGGFFGALNTLATSRPIFAANSVGIGRAALDTARRWVKENRVHLTERRRDRVEAEFGRLANHLDEASRAIMRATWMRDTGRDNRTASSIAKALAPPAAEAACRRALELLGASGTSEASLVEKWYRDIKVYDILEGSGQIQRVTVSRSLLGSAASRG